MSAAPFPRWRSVVGVLGVTLTISWGLLFYAFGVLVPAMRAELGWSQTFLGGAFSLALGVSALLAVPVGRFLECCGPRAAMSTGSLVGALGLIGWSQVEQPWAFLVVAGLLGVAHALCLYEAAFTAVVGCLGAGRRTDLALLALTILAGFASTLFVPLTQALETRHGWRATLQVLAFVLVATTFLPHLWVLRGVPGRAHVAVESAASSRPARLAGTALAFGLGVLSATAVAVFLVTLLREAGHGARFAALAASGIGLGQVGGRIAFTVLGPRVSLRSWGLVLFGLPALAVIPLARGGSEAAVLAAVGLFFAATGAQTLARARFALDLFSPAAFARVNAVIGTSSQLGRAAAPLALGALRDVTGSHRAGLLVVAVLCATAALCAGAVGRRQHQAVSAFARSPSRKAES